MLSFNCLSQYDVYRNVLALPEFALLKRRREPCDCGRRDGYVHTHAPIQ